MVAVEPVLENLVSLPSGGAPHWQRQWIYRHGLNSGWRDILVKEAAGLAGSK
jgi:hypothetical protein